MDSTLKELQFSYIRSTQPSINWDYLELELYSVWKSQETLAHCKTFLSSVKVCFIGVYLTQAEFTYHLEWPLYVSIWLNSSPKLFNQTLI